MVADTGLGWAYPATIELTDANGSPLSGAPSAGGTTNVYGPGSATTILHTATASDLSNGNYGINVPGSVHTVAGGYRAVIPTITVNGYTFTNQEVFYTVGLIPPEYRTLRAIVVAVAQALRIGIASRTTGEGTASTLVDSRWVDAGMADNEMNWAEIVIFEPEAAGDASVVRVTASNHSTGTLTFSPSVTDVDGGTDYLLLSPTKYGDRYDQILEAIVAAVADLATRQTVTDAVTLTTTRGTRQYTLPGSWIPQRKQDLTIEIARQPTAWDPYWETVAPVYYDLWPDRRQINFAIDFGTEYLLRLTGPVGVPEPRALGGIVKVPWTKVRDMAVGMLSVPPEQRAGLAFRRGMQAGTR